MIEILEELGLDANYIKRQRDVSRSIGQIFLAKTQSLESSRDSDMSYYAAATNFRRAAANSILLDDTQEARHLFHAAASAYSKAGSAYGVLLENLGDNGDNTIGLLEEEPRDGQDVFLMLASIRFPKRFPRQENRRAEYRRKLDGYKSQKLGVLGMRVETYLDIYDSLEWPTDVPVSERVRHAIFPLLTSYATAIRQCKSDHYHWKRMAIPFHPAEPDVMATMVLVNRALMNREISFRSIISNLPLGSDAFRLLHGALVQYGNWANNQELG